MAQLPIDQVLGKLEKDETVPKPINADEIRRLDLKALDPVDVDVVTLDVRDDLREAVTKRNNILKLDIAEDVDIFDKQLNDLLSQDVKKVSEEDVLKAISFKNQLD